MRSYAIEQIYKTLKSSPRSLPKFGKDYDVEDWVFIGVDMLVRRMQPLNAEDVKSIGMDEILKLASLRECCFNMGGYGETCKEKRGSMRRSDILDERIKAEYNLSSIPAARCRPLELPEWAI